MEKEQNRLVTKAEIKKDRVIGFPFHIVSTTYSIADLYFIVAADNVAEVLSVYPFTNDMNKLITSTIPLTNILTKKLISTIHILSLTLKPSSSSVVIQHAEFILGYRTGQLIVVEYKERECKVKERYNKSLKGEGFLSRASSTFFGSDEQYTPYFTAPIRSFSVHPSLPNFCFIWQVGNNIFLQKQFNQGKQNKFLNRYENLHLQNFILNYDVNKIVKQGNLFLYGCDYYTAMLHPELAITLISFKFQISSFTVLEEKKELVVSLSSKEIILVIDFNHFVVKSRIYTEMPMRRLASFQIKGQSFIVCMPYENYLILYSLSSNSYCKLKGHKSFIASTFFNRQNQRIITAGMDHQICLIRLASVKQQNWLLAQKLPQKCWKIKQSYVNEQKFQDIYKLQETNTNRSNLYSYGYAGLFSLNGYFCFPTYDSRITIYRPFAIDK